jgi:hypothetical protein
MDIKLLQLRDALAQADTRAVTEMVEQNRNLLHARLPGNVTPLMYVLFREFSELSEHLIRIGAKIDIVTAVLMGDTDAVRNILTDQPWLVKKHSPWGGYSLLHIGARYGDTAMVRLFLEQGIDPNEAKQPDRITPLFFSYKAPYENAELLLSCGANINARAKHGQTVLHQAMMHEDPEWIKFLLQHGADPNLQTKTRESPWMLAVKWKRFQAAALLEEFSRDRLHFK